MPGVEIQNKVRVQSWLESIRLHMSEWEWIDIRLGIIHGQDVSAICLGEIVLTDRKPDLSPLSTLFPVTFPLRLIHTFMPIGELSKLMAEIEQGHLVSVAKEAVFAPAKDGKGDTTALNASYQPEFFTDYKEDGITLKSKRLSISSPKLDSVFDYGYTNALDSLLPSYGYQSLEEVAKEFCPNAGYRPHDTILVPVFAPTRVAVTHKELSGGAYWLRLRVSKKIDRDRLRVVLRLKMGAGDESPPSKQPYALTPDGWQHDGWNLVYDIKEQVGIAESVEALISYRDKGLMSPEVSSEGKMERERKDIARSQGIFGTGIVDAIRGVPERTQPRPKTKAKANSFETNFDTYTRVEQQPLGQGGSGKVYKAKDSTGKLVAIKVLDPDKATSEKRKRFKNELTFGQKNTHPNIIRILDWGLMDEGKVPFYVMPLYPTSLRAVMNDKLDHKQIMSLFASLMDGVEAAHVQNVIHRDLKPENILVDPASGGLVVADWGIAHFEEETLYTIADTIKQGSKVFNVGYAAPEQKVRGTVVTSRADIFALGLILNEMYTGVIPQGTGHKRVSQVVSEAAYLDAVIDQMIRQDPAERFGLVGEVRREIAHYEKFALSDQKLSKLTGKVVPVTESDDPFIQDPVRLVEVDWANRILILKFQHKPSQQWIEAFRSTERLPGIYLMNKGPTNFDFLDNRATIAAEEGEVQDIVDRFKVYLGNANAVYKQRVERTQAEERRKNQEAFEREKALEEARIRVLKNVKM